MMTPKLAALLIGVSILAGAQSAAAVEAIPEACLKCRSASDDASFVTCLYDCLGSVSLKDFADENAGSDTGAKADANASENAKAEARAGFPTIQGWTLDEDDGVKKGTKQRTAVRSSEKAFSWFFDIVEPNLVLAKAEKNPVIAVVDFSPAMLQGFSDRVLVQVDDNKVRAYRAQIVWQSHAVMLDDPALLKEMKAGKRLFVRMEIFGAGTRTISFDLKGTKAVCKWLDELDATKS